MKLSREVRFAITDQFESRVSNSWSGWPSTNLLVPRLSLVTVVQGEPDVQSGYICNIKVIDDLIREIIENEVIPQYRPSQSAEYMLQRVYGACQSRWPTLEGADTSSVQIVKQTLVVTPQIKYSIEAKDSSMVCLTQQFEFSASHRLHNPALSNDENKSLFGKCNNPNGHGHNYVVEVSLSQKRDDVDSSGINLATFESRVKELVIDRLDHKHLNSDVEYFSKVNPSVENIAIAIWNWLDGQFGEDQLTNIRVYETPKTWADYSG